MPHERRILTGLEVDDYISPEEQKMKLSNDIGAITAGLNALNDICTAFARQITLGRHIELTGETAPQIHEIIVDICNILDYSPVPKIYMCHQPAQELYCAGTNVNQITFSDYLLEKFDTDMLYFVFGELIATFKGGHTKLSTICSFLPPIPQAMALELPLKAYLRAADLSSDRGGLLACQDFSAAAKCILWDAGIPMKDLSSMNETEIIQLSKDYIDAVEGIVPDFAGQLAGTWQKLNMESMPHMYRLKKLLAWYQDEYHGYQAVMANWQ